jgi:A/G-specific adenine glycosylase
MNVKNYTSAAWSAKIKAFKKTIKRYYSEQYRDMPWRSDTSPYSVFVSEVMLQQTQVDRVIPKFNAFVKIFTSFEDVSKASLTEIFSLWQGLGYNRRAKWLRESARIICSAYNGVLPETIDELKTLPGIGYNTAAAICAYAFNKPVVYIETNIRTVIIHHFFNDSHDVDDDDIFALAELSLDKKNPRSWYWALMDYGTILKKQHPNPSRKSATYKKQPLFNGSQRKLRGMIMKCVSRNNSISIKKLYKNVDSYSQENVNAQVKELVRENMLKEEKGFYRISD